jgi:triosephosphate isomerase (TIM)
MNYIYIANWKMNLSFNQSISFCTQHSTALQQLAHNNATIIICPSFVALASVAELFKKSSIAVGAQNCSHYEQGAYTGEVSAQSLAQAGATYCIIGHSERRTYFNETNTIIAQKTTLLMAHAIQPIICIGETKTDFESKKVHAILTQQLEPLFTAIQRSVITIPLIIAYEPVWSIGTGIIPEYSYLKNIFGWLKETITHNLPNHKVHLIYGGSVNPTNSIELKKIPFIEGFLIGSASTNFNEFADIIT